MKIGARKNQTRTGAEFVGFVKTDQWTQYTGIRRLTRADAIADAAKFKQDYQV